MEYTPSQIKFFAAALKSIFLSKSNEQYATELYSSLKKAEKDGVIADLSIHKNTSAGVLKSTIAHYYIKCLCGSTSVSGLGADIIEINALLSAIGELIERYVLVNLDFTEQAVIWDYCLNSISYEKIMIPNTNGMAFHTNFFLAVENGLMELYERHFLLATWYGKLAPQTECFLGHIQYFSILNSYFKRNKINCRYFEISKEDGIYTVCILIWTEEVNNGFYIIPSFASGYTLLEAFYKAAKELIRIMINKPLEKRNKQYSTVEDINDTVDHFQFYQQPDRIKCFNFMINAKCINQKCVESQKLNKFQRIKILHHALMAKKVNIYLLPIRKLNLEQYFCVKLKSSLLLELWFGRNHDKFDHKLLRELSGGICDLTYPHPLN